MSRINIPDSELWAHGGEKEKPDLNRFEKGNESGATATAPKHSDHNYEMNRADQNLQYILRNGLLPWDDSENYPLGAVVRQGSKNYECIKASTGNNPATEQEYWKLILPSWDDVTGKPSTFPPSAHTHDEGDINGLENSLAAKADWKSQNLDLTGKPQTSWFAVHIDFGLNSFQYRASFLVRGGSGKGSDPYVDTIVSGWVQNSGWSSARPGYDIDYIPYNTSQTCVHSLWRGTSSFSGFVIYLRGGFNYTFRTDAKNTRILEATGIIGDATFPSNVEDPTSGGSKREMLLNFSELGLGKYVYGNVELTSTILARGMHIKTPAAVGSRFGGTAHTAVVGTSNLNAEALFGVDPSGGTGFTDYLRIGKDVFEYTWSDPDGTVHVEELFRESKPPANLLVPSGRGVSDFKDVRFIPFANGAADPGFPADYGAGLFVPRLASGSYYGFGFWCQTSSNKVYFMKQRTDGSGFIFHEMYTAANPPPETGVGQGQSYKTTRDGDITRIKNTDYTNDTGQPITVTISGLIRTPPVDVAIVVGGKTIQGASYPEDGPHSCTFIVPPGVKYRLQNDDGYFISDWAELR